MRRIQRWQPDPLDRSTYFEAEFEYAGDGPGTFVCCSLAVLSGVEQASPDLAYGLFLEEHVAANQAAAAAAELAAVDIDGDEALATMDPITKAAIEAAIRQAIGGGPSA